MRVLDLFCGMGGWSIGFHREGFDCDGLDLVDVGYPYNFIGPCDIRKFVPNRGTYDVITASPPCTEWSQLNHHPNLIRQRGLPNVEKGKELVKEAKRVIDEADPEFWVLENVRGSLKHIYPILGGPICRYGPWMLWGNFPPSLIKDGIKKWEGSGTGSWLDRSGRHDPLASWLRAKIPLPLSLSIAQACKGSILSSILHTSTRGGGEVG